MNNCCTFFGHRICPKDIKEVLYTALKNLIEEKNVTTFLLGEEGSYDKYVLEVLEQLSTKYKNISYTVVKAYLRNRRSENFKQIDFSKTVFPDEITKVPKRFAISRRNDWMLKQSKYVITYITHLSGGGASDFKEKAINSGKTVIELSSFIK